MLNLSFFQRRVPSSNIYNYVGLSAKNKKRGFLGKTIYFKINNLYSGKKALKFIYFKLIKKSNLMMLFIV